MPLELTYAGGLYDRTLSLKTGEIRPDGVQIDYQVLPLQTVFSRMLDTRAWHVSEMSLASYIIARERGAPDLVAIPAFPSRHFRLGCIFVRDAAPYTTLEQLRGARVASPQYQMTAAVWVRGMLADHFGVPVDSVRWVSGTDERLAIALPPGISLQRHRGPGSLEDALVAEKIDALMTTSLPSRLGAGVRRLLHDSRQAEAALFRRTGIFPIMHTVVMRGEVAREHPHVARSVYDAFAGAKAQAIEALRAIGVVRHSLPWLLEELEATEALMGRDFWPYGVARNRQVVATLVRYLHEQGLLKGPIEPDALFAPTTLDT